MPSRKKPSVEAGISAVPMTHSVGVGTTSDQLKDDPTHTVHPGPNVKYDVVVHQETR